MKNLGLYFLIVVVAACNTGLYELARIPAFFSHYTQHASQNKAISMVDFIAMHYMGRDADNNDDTQDNALPFKSSRHNHTDAFWCLMADAQAAVYYPTCLVLKKIPYHNKVVYDIALTGDIKPPAVLKNLV